MKTQMTIGKKLTLAFGAVLALLLGLAYSDLSSVTSLGDLLSTEITQTSKKVQLAGDLSTYTYQMRTGQRGLVMYTMLKDSASVDQSKAMFEDGKQGLQRTIAELRPMLVVPVARQALDSIDSEFKSWLPAYEQVLRACATRKFTPEFERLLSEVGTANQRMVDAARQVLQVQRDIEREAARNAASSLSWSRWVAFGLIAICLGVGGLVLWLVRAISGTLRRLAEQLAEGASQTASAASQVSSSSQSLAQGSSEQAASIEETSASSEEIGSMARKNTDSSRNAAGLVAQSQQKFLETNQSLDQMVAAMNDINAQSHKISKIIKVIDEISFQTNILALNAAVEAARAGESGMGFAVVADEVRNLAQRCAQAARDTAGLIEESIEKSNDGKTKVDQVAQAIRSITEESARVKALVDAVNVSSQEQATGIEQIGKAIAQMEQVTQQVAANAEESASAAEELNAQSETVMTIVGQLTAMVGSTSRADD